MEQVPPKKATNPSYALILDFHFQNCENTFLFFNPLGCGTLLQLPQKTNTDLNGQRVGSYGNPQRTAAAARAGCLIGTVVSSRGGVTNLLQPCGEGARGGNSDLKLSPSLATASLWPNTTGSQRARNMLKSINQPHGTQDEGEEWRVHLRRKWKIFSTLVCYLIMG